MSASEPDDRNPMTELWNMAIVICGIAPITIALFLGGGLGDVAFGHDEPIDRTVNSTSKPSERATKTGLDPAVKWQTGNHTHGLSVNPTNPNVIYLATHHGLIQRTETGKWFWMQPKQQRADYMGFTADPTNSQRFYASGHPQTGGNLVVDPVNADRVFAVTPAGLYQSIDRGETWGLIPNTQKTSVVGLALQTEADKTVMYGFRASKSIQGIDRSLDGGQTWQKWGTGTKGIILYLAIAPSNPKMFYAVNRENTVFQSQDGGKTWKVLG